MITPVLEQLPRVTEAQRQQIITSARTEEAHRSLLAQVPCMNAVQKGGVAQADVLPDAVTIAAWNVERCLFPEETAAHVATIKPDIVLLSEVDHGMARTAQRHTTADVAASLGMEYAFAVEFLELDLGSGPELAFCKDDFNACGWHGNAVLSSVPFQKIALIRLDDHGHWFVPQGGSGATDPNQPRLGGRMAIAAIIETTTGPLCVVSTHLESNADGAHRDRQFALLMDAVDAFAPGMPTVIGGDLNTGNHMPPDYDWRKETLFDAASARGYSWDFTADGPTTRPSLITPHPTRTMKLDWLAGRGATPVKTGVLPSLLPDGKPLSDHDCVWCTAQLT